MALVWFTAGKQIRAQACVTRLNAGKIVVGTDGYNGSGTGTKLAEFTLANPMGTVSGEGLVTLPNSILTTTTIAEGAPATAIFVDSANVPIGGGMTVGQHIDGEPDPDFVIDGNYVFAGQNMSIAASGSFIHG